MYDVHGEEVAHEMEKQGMRQRNWIDRERVRREGWNRLAVEQIDGKKN